MKATDKQIRFVKVLLSKAGMNTQYVNREWAKFGARMSERSGKVEDISFDLASAVINALK